MAAGSQPATDEGFPKGLGAAAGLTAFGASGFIPFKDKRLWDYYINAVRGVETGFPAAILRTFRVSESLSPLETWSKISISAPEMKRAGVYTDYLRHVFGDVKDVTLKPAGKVFGEVHAGGKVIGMGIQMEGGPPGRAISDYYARVMGVDLSLHKSLTQDYLKAQYKLANVELPFDDWVKFQKPRMVLGVRLREKATILGQEILFSGKQQRAIAKAEVLYNVARAKAATTTGRLNVLLSKPFDVPVIGPALSKFPFLKKLAVEPGTQTEMFGRFIKKGLMIGAGWKALEYYDYLRSEGSVASLPFGTALGGVLGGTLFSKAGRAFSSKGLAIGAALGAASAVLPRFEHGLFHGIASAGADINIARAQVSQTIGLTESLKEQEEVTPGLTSFKTALGFTGVGALLGGLSSYTTFLGASFAEKVKSKGKETIVEIFERLRLERSEKLGKIWTETGVGRSLAKLPGVGKFLGKIKHPAALGAVVGLGAWAGLSTGLGLLSGNILAAVPGAGIVGTEETSEELQAIYSGEKEIAVRKGRFWEASRGQAWEGGAVDFYRPHALARLKSRAYQKGIYDDEAEKFEYDPLLNPLKALFGSDEWKYYYERKNQFKRGAPQTSTYFSGVPFIGPLLAETIGVALKPRKFVRPEEWYKGGEYLYHPERLELEPSYELGGLEPGVPVSPGKTSQVLNELIYKRREAVGLPGFAAGAIQKEITGREEYFQNLQTMGEMGKETGSEYWLWEHLNLGGAILSSEGARRFIPRTRSYLDEYNPLQNEVPSWYPKDYFLDPRMGDSMKKFPEYEIRSAGPGYESLHPELEGVDPENYPSLHKLKILGDLFHWSDEYRSMARQEQKRKWQMSESDQMMLETIQEQVSQKKQRREFTPYRFTEDLSPVSSEIEAQYSAPERLAGKAWETIAHSMETPFEYLTPFSPAAKLIRQRSALEEYKKAEAVGTSASFWDRPLENFLLPGMEMLEHKLGDKEVAGPHQARRETSEYFDMLKWVKESRLEQQAAMTGQTEEMLEHRRQKRSTLFGMDPFSSAGHIMSVLPRRERDFFTEFASAQTEEARSEILSLVPENERKIYAAQWLKQEQEGIRERKEAETATKADLQREQAIQAVRRTDGMGTSNDLEEQWLAETGGNSPIDDWLREKKAKQYFATHSLPGAGWLGWNSQTDLEDIKMKYVENTGCLSGDSCLFDTELNEVPAGLITKEVSIMNSKGKETKPQEIFKYFNNKRMYQISNTGIHIGSIFVTENHKIPIVRASNASYIKVEVEAKDIRPRDKMLYPKMFFSEILTKIDLLDFVNQNSLTKFIILSEDKRKFCYHNSKKRQYIRKIILDENFGKFLGWYIAEGWIEYKKNCSHSVGFSLNLKEQNVAEWLIKYAYDTFGAKGSIVPEKKAKALKVLIHSPGIANLLISFCAGKKAITKFLTNSFMNLSKKTILSALLSWFYGDGWVGSDGGRLYISTSSKKLAKQGWFILNSLGIRTRLQVVKAKWREKTLVRYSRKSYRLGIGNPIARLAFLSSCIVNQADYYKVIKLEEGLESYFWFGVKKKFYEVDSNFVYDFNIGKPHFYTTICGIVHNSDIHDHDLWEDRRKMLARKPYINEELLQEMNARASLEDVIKVDVQANLLGKQLGASRSGAIMHRVGGNIGNSYNVTIQDGRQGLIDKAYKQLGF